MTVRRGVSFALSVPQLRREIEPLLPVGVALVVRRDHAGSGTGRRHLALGTSSGIALLFDYGGRVPVWPVLLMMTTVYFTGLRRYVRRRAETVEADTRLCERAGIAADMHDSLGHDLTLIAVQAGVLQVSSGLDERHRKAVAELRESAAAATERLRGIIDLLRDDETISGLIARSVASGMTIKSTVDEIPSGIEQVVYRVVQEALTNAAKHAPGATVVVEISATSVSVVNEPPTEPPTRLASGGNGKGLDGVRKRVQRAGGVLHAGPRAGGFAVTATFPT